MKLLIKDEKKNKVKGEWKKKWKVNSNASGDINELITFIRG
jgi:hypothetical protein